ncbi:MULTISPECIES: hypothetical protein [Streptosporangium]|uniref:Glycosyltransferase RgtA/B/C/D-like domain-containing protein n=1 Tax=Streptosporangium brasiliense TaxID=47480 RepID=A0ABT9R0C0_9ACTN|nr:hypothetical protein [Streptosporangium brasiliense]MDP9862677.1 hypothetical protein [Streptosporangium brasiliense]
MEAMETGRSEPPALRITLPGWLAALRGPVLPAAVALIVASLVLRALILRDSYFVEDDLLFVGNAYENDLTLDYVTRVHKGHFMPGAIALTWVLSRIAPYDWLLVAAVTLAAQALLGVLALRLLRTLFGTRPAILPPLALLLFSPLTVPAFGWWAAAVNAVPLQLVLVLALTAQVRFTRGEGARYGRHALAWCVAGMAFSTKGVFVAFLLYALTTAFLRNRETGWVRSMCREARRHWRLWSVHVMVVAAYTIVYLARMGTAPGEGASVPDPDVAVDLVSRLLGRTFPSGAVGGPVTWAPVTPTGGLAGPSDAVVALSWTVLAALLAVTVVHRRRALRAWIVLAGYLLFADAVPTVIARGGHVALVGAETRYVADAAVVLAVCLGLALLPVKGEDGAYRRALPARAPLVLVAGLTTGAYLVLSVISTVTYRETLSGERVRAYLDTAAAQLAAAPDNVVIYPTPLPGDIVLSWNGDRRLSSRLLAPLARPAVRVRMAHPEPTEDARVFNRDGKLVRMKVFGFFAARTEDQLCLPVANGAAAFPDALSFGGPATAGALAYSADRPVSVTVEVGQERIVLNLRKTPGGLIHFPVTAVSRGMRIVMDDPTAPVCLAAVALGAPAAEGEPSS